MATEVEELIQEQAMTNLNLEILAENKDVFESILLEVEITNETLNRNSRELVALENKTIDSFKAVGSFLSAKESFSDSGFEVIQEAFKDTIEIKKDEEGNEIGEEFLEPLKISEETLSGIDDKSAQSLFRLINIDRGISELIGNSEIKELEATGKSVDRQNKDEKDKKSIFDNFKLSSIPGLSGIGPAIASAVGPLLGVAAVGLFAKGAFDAINDDKLIKELTGKAKDDLKSFESGLVGVSGGIETLTFGLLDAKTVFETMESIPFLFDEADGLFNDFIKGFGKILEGDFLGGFGDIQAAVITIPSKLIGGVLKLIKLAGNSLIDFFAPEELKGELKESFSNFLDPFINLFSKNIPDAIKTLLVGVTDTVKGIGTGIMQLFAGKFEDGLLSIGSGLLTGLKGIGKAIIDLISDVFDGFLPDNIKKEFNDKFGIAKNAVLSTFDKIVSIPEKIAKFFSEFASDISNFIGEKLSSIASKLPFGGDTLKSVADFFLSDKKDIRENKGLNVADDNLKSSINIPFAKSPNNIDAEKTGILSKKRFDEEKVVVSVTPPQPVIVQSQPREVKTIERRKNPDDMFLAAVGQGI